MQKTYNKLAISDLRNPINLVVLQHHSSLYIHISSRRDHIHIDYVVDPELHLGLG
jgi:hypothetical protein